MLFCAPMPTPPAAGLLVPAPRDIDQRSSKFADAFGCAPGDAVVVRAGGDIGDMTPRFGMSGAPIGVFIIGGGDATMGFIMFIGVCIGAAAGDMYCVAAGAGALESMLKRLLFAAGA